MCRAMPNTAIAIQGNISRSCRCLTLFSFAESMTCVSLPARHKAHEAVVLDIFNRLGKAIVIDEELMAAGAVQSLLVC